MGPYRLADRYADRQIPASTWHKLGGKEKTARLKWLDSKYKPNGESATVTTAVRAEIVVPDYDECVSPTKPGPPPGTTADTKRTPVTGSNSSDNSILGDFAMTNLPEKMEQ